MGKTSVPHARRTTPANRLLASLPPADLARVTKSLERVHLRLGQVLHEPHQSHEHLYFPETCNLAARGPRQWGYFRSLTDRAGRLRRPGTHPGRRQHHRTRHRTERGHCVALEGGGAAPGVKARRIGREDADALRASSLDADRPVRAMQSPSHARAADVSVVSRQPRPR